MAEYQQTQTIQATPDDVLAWVADVRNLPRYLPTTKDAQTIDADHVRVQGQAGDQTYDAEGYMRVDIDAHRMEWGSEEPDRYWGYLTINPSEAGTASEVTVHVNFGPSSYAPEVPQEMAEGGRDPMEDGVRACLLSIKNHLEGQGGKVRPPEEPA